MQRSGSSVVTVMLSTECAVLIIDRITRRVYASLTPKPESFGER
jgi:hypothetical protein